MRCYFLRNGRIAGVEILPPELSDEDAIARARTLFSKRKGPFDGFEVWDRAGLRTKTWVRLATVSKTATTTARKMFAPWRRSFYERE
jgi:hypothetical protein